MKKYLIGGPLGGQKPVQKKAPVRKAQKPVQATAPVTEPKDLRGYGLDPWTAVQMQKRTVVPGLIKQQSAMQTNRMDPIGKRLGQRINPESAAGTAMFASSVPFEASMIQRGATFTPPEPTTPEAAPGFDWKKAGESAAKVAPFISNLANSFRRAPQSQLTQLAQMAPFTPVRFSRQPWFDAYKTQMSNINRGLDENVGQAAFQTSYLKTLQSLGQLTEQEAALNMQGKGQYDMLSLRNQNINAQMRQENLDNNTNMKMANITQQSANLANAGDKAMAMYNIGIDSKNLKYTTDMYMLNDQYGTQGRLYDRVAPLYRGAFGVDNQSMLKKAKKGGPLMKKLYRLGGPVVQVKK